MLHVLRDGDKQQRGGQTTYDVGTVVPGYFTDQHLLDSIFPCLYLEISPNEELKWSNTHCTAVINHSFCNLVLFQGVRCFGGSEGSEVEDGLRKKELPQWQQ